MYQFDSKEHLHTLNGKPLTGTSTVMSVVAKPLTWWASGKAVGHLGWTNGKYMDHGKWKTVALEERVAIATPTLERLKEMSGEEYVALLDEAYKAHSVSLKDSAESGTDLHAELERFVKFCMETGIPTPDTEDAKMFDQKIQPFVGWAFKNVKRFLWSEMHTYSEQHWVGGITDAGAELKDGNIAVIDFKSSKDAYPTHFWQIAGYDIQITENGGYNAKGEKVFTLEKPITQHIVVPFGSKDGLPVVSREVVSGKKAFLAALTLYRELNKLENQ